MKIGIYGAGAMGTVLGAYITRAGYDIDLINRNLEHVHALNENGAKIIGKIEFTQAVKAITPKELKEKYDIILLMTKQKYNKEISESLLPFLKDKSLVCTMQNGLPEKSVADVIGKDRTCGCTMSWGATFHGKGVSELTSEPTRETLTFSIGKYGDNDDVLFNYIVELLDSMGEVKIENNFTGARWAKLMINSAFSGLSVVTGATFGEIAKNKNSRLLALKIIKECIEVTKAGNIKVEPLQGKDIIKLLDYNSKFKKWISMMLIPIAMKKHKLIKSSMLRDLNEGKNTEIDYINGMVCEYGDLFKVDTPLNDKVVSIVHSIENKELQPSWNNLLFFK
ncbi:MAG: ketopantoate reductase family protein [Candidatus Izemoplasmatales bacterium]|jgi:2-dehydropantoate 2-reductase|nr:ketopantoate reductase family protein [Candidatus Izemoplasmatales bacterium]